MTIYVTEAKELTIQGTVIGVTRVACLHGELKNYQTNKRLIPFVNTYSAGMYTILYIKSPGGVAVSHARIHTAGFPRVLCSSSQTIQSQLKRLLPVGTIKSFGPQHKHDIQRWSAVPS